MNEIQNSILKSLCYGDVFDYPLTFTQLHAFLISQKKISKKELEKALRSFWLVKKKGNYFYLKGRSDVIFIRRRRQKESIHKIQEAKKIARLISHIPYIQFVGLSGSVALKNCEKNHDIDLFIVTQANTLWISRFFVLFLLFILRKRRKPFDTRTQNKICANMFLTSQTLKMPVSKRNVYTAHEVVQVMPLINKLNTYETFLYKNNWIQKYLANFPISSVNSSETKTNSIVSAIDTLYFYFQRFYMRKKITTESVTKNAAFFHPVNYKQLTLNMYQTKYKHYQNVISTKSKIGQKNNNNSRSKNILLASIFTPGS